MVIDKLPFSNTRFNICPLLSFKLLCIQNGLVVVQKVVKAVNNSSEGLVFVPRHACNLDNATPPSTYGNSNQESGQPMMLFSPSRVRFLLTLFFRAYIYSL